MKSARRRFAALGAVLVVLFGIAVVVASPASAGTGLYYTVVDADNDPYSGIYLRDGTSMGNVRRIPERYMLYGTRVELNCGAWGEAVGPYANRRWHNVRVATGATTNQVGWIADRYLNTPNKANQPTPGEPECGAPPPPTYNGSVYYSPPSPNDLWSPATIHMSSGQWAPGNCSASQAGNFPSWVAPSNKYITQMGGWSIGRLGPVYFLEANSHRWQEIDYILLFDPGNFDDLMGNQCDTMNNRGQLYTHWLKANPNARLVILAGGRTGESAHRGIQELYFNYLRANGGPRDRVVVCNYDGMGHADVFTNFRGQLNEPPITKTTCPGNESWTWNP